jgi:hypothetical protein
MRLSSQKPVFMHVSLKPPKTNLWFYPHGSKKGSRFESFREAWWLLDPVMKGTET